MSQIEREYSYKPSWIAILLAGGLFALGAVMMGYAATTNDRGLILNGILELSTPNATKFYWVISGVCLCFVIAAVMLAVMRLWNSQRIAFTADCLIVPKSRWSSAERAIDFRDITNLSTSVINRQRFLTIHHTGGKFSIVASMLPSKESFEEICQLLAQRVRRP